MIPNIEEASKFLLKNFDFQSIHNYMKENKWKWIFPSSEDKIPSVDEIILEARRLLDELSYLELSKDKSTFHSIECGGLKAFCKTDGSDFYLAFHKKQSKDFFQILHWPIQDPMIDEAQKDIEDINKSFPEDE
jgi:hypothetical protein